MVEGYPSTPSDSPAAASCYGSGQITTAALSLRFATPPAGVLASGFGLSGGGRSSQRRLWRQPESPMQRRTASAEPFSDARAVHPWPDIPCCSSPCREDSPGEFALASRGSVIATGLAARLLRGSVADHSISQRSPLKFAGITTQIRANGHLSVLFDDSVRCGLAAPGVG